MRARSGPSLLFSVFVFPFAFAFAAGKPAACKTGDRVMRIGCTVECEEPYRKALNDAAAKLGFKIEIVTLSSAAELDGVDGVLSPGGHDIDPKYYTRNVGPDEKARIEKLHERFGNGGKTEPRHLARDEREFAIVRRLFEGPKDQPFLGVCYGMQMMAAVEGIPLTVDMKEQLGIGDRRKVHDDVDMTKDSWLRRYVPGDRLKGYKNHHQSVSMDYWSAHASKHPNVAITGTSHAGKIAEILQLKDRPALGIQFHAERTEGDERARLAPYEWFLEQACLRKPAARPPARKKAGEKVPGT